MFIVLRLRVAVSSLSSSSVVSPERKKMPAAARGGGGPDVLYLFQGVRGGARRGEGAEEVRGADCTVRQECRGECLGCALECGSSVWEVEVSGGCAGHGARSGTLGCSRGACPAWPTAQSA